ncbi:MAG: DUF2784 domain-containing protein [Pseudomonadota bacterium]
MSAATIADITLLLHLLFILFVLFGGLLPLYRPWFAFLHIPMLLWGVIVNIAPLRCPLTPMENHYRQLAGQAGYEGGFVEHYIAPLIYPEGLTADFGIFVGSATLLWNVLVYGFVIYRKRRARHP